MSKVAQFQIGEHKFVNANLETDKVVGGEGDGDELVVEHRLKVPGNNERLGSTKDVGKTGRMIHNFFLHETADKV